MQITVVGMGKIGLPLAVQYAMKGHCVFGADINPRTVELINRAEVPFPGEANLAKFLERVVASGLLSATEDTTAVMADSDAAVVVVPLSVDSQARPDFRAMDAAAEAVGRGMKAGTLVSFETTLPVGTTRNRLAPILERASGLVAEQDFNVVFSPERVLTGRVFADLRRYPKLVGGLSRSGEERGCAFYRDVLDFDERLDLKRPNGVWAMGSAEAAEMAKLAETTYRDVNIALANQFAQFAERSGIDAHRVIEACNSQPYSHIHQPGIAVGGHCIPVYPRLYLWNDPDATVVREARSMNASMPERVVGRLEEALGGLGEQRVVVLGAAYRGGVKETAFSGVWDVVASLEGRGARVLVHDPLYTDDELTEMGLTPYHRGEPAQAAIVQADHDMYATWSASDIPGVRVIVDGRRMLSVQDWAPAQVLAIGQST